VPTGIALGRPAQLFRDWIQAESKSARLAPSRGSIIQ